MKNYTFEVTIAAQDADTAASILAGCDDGIQNVEPAKDLADHFTYWEFQGLTALVEMRIVEAQNAGDGAAVQTWNALLEKLNADEDPA